MFERIPEVIAALGAAASLSAAVAGAAAIRRHKEIAPSGAALLTPPPPPEPPTTETLEQHVRIPEAQAALKRQEATAKLYRRVSATLSTGQYLVGAALASAFIQASLNEYWIGALGLVVLFSQVIQQRLRPGVRALGATDRALRLRQAIRSAEDEIYAMQTNPDATKSALEIRRSISDALGEIKRLEAQEELRRPKEPEPRE